MCEKVIGVNLVLTQSNIVDSAQALHSVSHVITLTVATVEFQDSLIQVAAVHSVQVAQCHSWEGQYIVKVLCCCCYYLHPAKHTCHTIYRFYCLNLFYPWIHFSTGYEHCPGWGKKIGIKFTIKENVSNCYGAVLGPKLNSFSRFA